MKFHPILLLLLGQLTLTAQPTLTLDYYFQDGLHEYDFLAIILGFNSSFLYETNWVFCEKEGSLLDKHPNS